MIKKFISLLMIITLLISCSAVNLVTFAETEVESEFTSSYEVNDPDWTEEELNDYYIQNNICPQNADEGASNKNLYDGDVQEHLTGRFKGYTRWTISDTTSKDVSDVYGTIPHNIYEYNPTIQDAKTAANIDRKYLGCGALAMISQLDYIGRSLEYSLFYSKNPTQDDLKELATEVFKDTYAVPGPGDSGTFISPISFRNAARRFLQNHNLSNKSDSSKSLIEINGDIVHSASKFETKIQNIKNSIDKGMPVVVWTSAGAGAYSNHYMNILGYEEWVGKDANNNQMSHLMLRIRYNWSGSKVGYMDCDVLKPLNCGFFFFEEVHNRTVIKPTDYNYPCSYNTNEISKTVTATFMQRDTTFIVDSLRAGYVKHYDATNTYVDNNYLTLSAKRQNAGTAYLKYNFNKAVSNI